ncbi:MAG: DUF1659 domain-containing protein [Thermovenabulum sp.]|uniref:DUF1659 domain-containing protein n=1 Tax=Thermovenabulum sp. TaxID=3100335 RepID=UPI003C7C0C3F
MVNATPVNAVLEIHVETGVDEQGKPVVKARSFRNLKTDAQDQDVMDVAKALAGLQAFNLKAVRKTVEVELTETV